jgi:hypothetical protein
MWRHPVVGTAAGGRSHSSSGGGGSRATASESGSMGAGAEERADNIGGAKVGIWTCRP